MMSKMIRLTSKQSRASLPLCTNVYDYGPSSGGGGGGSGTFSFSRLVPASDVGFSSSGNTIGVLNTGFVPSTITNPQRVLLGLPTISNIPTTSDLPLDLVISLSTSSDVNIVTRAGPPQFTGGEWFNRYFSGSQGFYFRNEVESDYYYMICSKDPTEAKPTTFGRRVVLVSVPKGKDVASASISPVPGLIATFGYTGVLFDLPATTPSFAVNQDHLFVTFGIGLAEGVGTLQPITSTTTIPIGTYSVTQRSGANRLELKFDVTDLTYVCFS